MDDDDRTYCYYGGLWGGQLEMWQSGSFDPDAHRPEGDEPALGPMFVEEEVIFVPPLAAVYQPSKL